MEEHGTSAHPVLLVSSSAMFKHGSKPADPDLPVTFGRSQQISRVICTLKLRSNVTLLSENKSDAHLNLKILGWHI